MTTPRYSKVELWHHICGLQESGKEISAIVRRTNKHRIVHLDKAKMRYVIEYADTGNVKAVSLDELYALYKELYSNGWLTRKYMEINCQRILGWKTLHAPGAAMRAILPVLDDDILVHEGRLSVRSIE